MIKVEGLCMKWELISITEKVLGEKLGKWGKFIVAWGVLSHLRLTKSTLVSNLPNLNGSFSEIISCIVLIYRASQLNSGTENLDYYSYLGDSGK